MEQLDVYDKDGKKTGRTIVRGSPVSDGDHLLVVHLCLFNKNGHMLIQKRHHQKERYPGVWDLSAGGFAMAGEDPLAAVLRETKEELGLSLAQDEVRHFLTVPFSYVFDHLFWAKKEIPLRSLSLQPEEVDDAMWASLDEVLRLERDNQFVDYGNKLLASCFAAQQL